MPNLQVQIGALKPLSVSPAEQSLPTKSELQAEYAAASAELVAQVRVMNRAKGSARVIYRNRVRVTSERVKSLIIALRRYG